MKKLLALSIVAAFLLITSCGEEVALTAPENFTISAGTDEVSVVLAWSENPSDEEVDGYYIYFNDAIADSTENTTYTHDDPQETGIYYVTAYRGEDESAASDELSTEPVIATGVQLYEIGVPNEESGYGWNTSTGQGAIYSMATAANASSIDLYFTNFATGYAGTYNIASPDEVLNDAGASWLQGTTGWKETGFAELTADFDDVTVLPTTGYFNFEEIAVNTTYGVYTEDGHYAMVEVQSISTSSGLVQVRTAFQTVEGLAILEH